MVNFCEDCNAELKTKTEKLDGVCDSCHAKESMSISDVLFSSPCKETGFCDNPECKTSVAQFPETGRWYITFGHAGYNSPANNSNGYNSAAAAKGAMLRYLTNRIGR